MDFGQAAVDTALQFQGTPYLWGGNNLSGGIDCSGLVQQVYGRLGVQLPRTTYEQVNMGTPINDLSQAEPGDLVFLHPSQAGPGHVGIYLGNGMIIDANHTGGSVGVRSLNGYGPIVAIRRVVNGGGPASTSLPPVGGMAAMQAYAPQPQMDTKSALDVVANMLGAPPASDTSVTSSPTNDITASPTKSPDNIVASPTSTVSSPQSDITSIAPSPQQPQPVPGQMPAGEQAPGAPGSGPGGDVEAQLKAGFEAAGRSDLANMVGTPAFDKWINAESGGNPSEVSAANNQGMPNGGLFQFWYGHQWAQPYFQGGRFTATPYQQAMLAAQNFPHLSPQAIQGYAQQIDAGTYRGWG